MQEQDFQTIHDIGIRSLYDRLKKYSGASRDEIIPAKVKNSSIKAPNKNENGRLISASGIYLEGVHFDLVYTPLKHLGHKLLSAAASHLYAVNGRPVSARIDLAVPNKISVSMLEQIYHGFDQAGKIYNCSVQPGDTTASRQMLVVSVHVEGIVREEEMITLEGCSTGDQICVTGDLGGAMAGLRVLLREKQAWQERGGDHFQPDLEEYEYVVGRQLMPLARHDLGAYYEKAEVHPTSQVDVSQGLINEMQLIAEANNLGCEIFTPAVPISLETRQVADEMQEDVDRYAFYGGEDYEMLFTLKKEDVEKLKAEFDDFTVIGEIKPAEYGIQLNTGEGKSIDIAKEKNQGL